VRVLTLYGKADCHLCDDARRALERVRQDIAFELVERDIEDDAQLLRAYFERIPVVTLDGRELFEFFVDEDALRRALAGPARPGDHLESRR
jgi:glutaredoxin